MNCNEFFLKDVLRVDVVLASTLDVAVPPTVPYIDTIALNLTGAINLFAASIVHDSFDSPLEVNDNGISVESRVEHLAAGHIFIHTVRFELDDYNSKIANMLMEAADKDFHLIYTTKSGDKFSYLLPESTSIEVSSKIGGKCEVTIEGKSVNEVIDVTA